MEVLVYPVMLPIVRYALLPIPAHPVSKAIHYTVEFVGFVLIQTVNFVHLTIPVSVV